MGIRVLLIAPSTNIVGGQSIQADRLLSAFRGDSGIDLRLLSIDAAIPSFIKRIPYARTAANAAFYYTGLLKGVLRSDIIHAFTSSFWGYTLWVIPAVWLARLCGRKIIVNYRDGRAEQHLQHWPSAVSTLKRTSAIVVPSAYLVEVFARFGLKAEVIPNVIDMAAFRFRERSIVRPVFLTNRGLEPLYNVDCTLRAFRLIQDGYPEACFVVANDGFLRSELEALAAELRLRNITFVGAVPQSVMVDLYHAADIYVMSPLIDNMPGTVLECFASGVPVVSTAAGGVPYIAEDGKNALLVTPGSAEELANACVRLLEEPGLASRLTREGYRDCSERYSVSSVRDQWRRRYATLLNSSDDRQAL